MPPTADTQAPSIPAGLVIVARTPDSVTITWAASSDNVAVTGYEVWVDGALAATQGGTQYVLGGLTAGASHSVAVRALDAAGNRSALSAPLQAAPQAAAIAHGGTYTITGVNLGTKADHNSGNYHYQGQRHLLARFSDFDNATTPVPATNTKSGWQAHLDGIFPTTVATDFNAFANRTYITTNTPGLNVRWDPNEHWTGALDISQSTSHLNPNHTWTSLDSDVGYGPNTDNGTNGYTGGIAVSGNNNTLPYWTAYGPNTNATTGPATSANFLGQNPYIIGSHVFPIQEQINTDKINQAKIVLANEATALCRGKEAADLAAETARKTFEEGASGDALPTLAVSGSIAIVDALTGLGFCASKGEAR